MSDTNLFIEEGNTEVVETPVTVTTPVTTSKASIARSLFVANYGKLARKDVIALFITEAGLTKAGAATYYQNFVKARKEGKL